VCRFFQAVRELYSGPVVCEPRHASWFQPEPEQVLNDFRVGRVAADPAVVPGAAEPGGWPGLVYRRWHGSPRMYYSEYDQATLDALALSIRAEEWFIFDNTAAGAALGNALQLKSFWARFQGASESP
jgi:uncharacterized protein YecE (DUF72 family)